jgi:hypothetical protein
MSPPISDESGEAARVYLTRDPGGETAKLGVCESGDVVESMSGIDPTFSWRFKNRPAYEAKHPA